MRFLPFVLASLVQGSSLYPDDEVDFAGENPLIKASAISFGFTTNELVNFKRLNEKFREAKDDFLKSEARDTRYYLGSIKNSFSQWGNRLTEREYPSKTRYILGEKIVTTAESVLFTARQYRRSFGTNPYNFIVKYMKSRPEVVEEYIMMKIASSDDGPKVSPSPVYLSPEFPGPGQHTPKCLLFDCDQEGLVFRYVIMERAGPSLMVYSKDLPLGRMGPKLLMHVLQASTMLLEALHDHKGIVHNDIHAGNICWKDLITDESRPDFTLIDFGVSRRILSDGNEKPLRTDVDIQLLSFWSLSGIKRPTRRDDVIRLIETIAMLWRGTTYRSFASNHEKLTEFKRSAKFFSLESEESDPLNAFVPFVDVENTQRVTGILDALAYHITHNTDIDERPDYQLIMKVSQYVLNCLNDKTKCEHPPRPFGSI